LQAWFCQECRIMMEVDECGDMCKCPKCLSEVWWKYGASEPTIKDPSPAITELMTLSLRNHKPREYLPAGEPTPGGGSKSCKVKKDKNKKQTLATLNRKLFGES